MSTGLFNSLLNTFHLLTEVQFCKTEEAFWEKNKFQSTQKITLDGFSNNTFAFFLTCSFSLPISYMSDILCTNLVNIFTVIMVQKVPKEECELLPMFWVILDNDTLSTLIYVNFQNKINSNKFSLCKMVGLANIFTVDK